MNKNNFLHKFKKVIWILTPFILLSVIIILLMKHCEIEEECFDCDEMQEKIDNIEQKIKDNALEVEEAEENLDVVTSEKEYCDRRHIELRKEYGVEQ